MAEKYERTAEDKERALITGLSNKQVAMKLLKYGLSSWCEGVVFLDELDEKMIRGEDVGRLRQIMPTPDEIEMLQSQDGAAAFGAAEKFLLLMAAVPRVVGL